MILQRLRRILVGVDLEDASRDASPADPAAGRAVIDHAIALASACQGELTLFSVLQFPDGDEFLTEQELDPEIASAEVALEPLVAAARAAGIVANARIVCGTAWLELIRESLRAPHDVVMVAARDNTRLERLLLGSTVMKLLRKCPVPVWVVRPGSGSATPTVLVADDLTEMGQQALHLAVSASQLLEAKLLVLHAVGCPRESRLRRTGASDQDIHAYRQTCHDAAERAIAERISRTDARTLPGGVRIELPFGRPDEAIEAAIAAHQVDLLVMGTVARTGIPGLLLGNTAERLLPLLPCSLLAIKPVGFVSPVTL